MKIRLLTPQRIIAPTGTVVDVEDSRAALLIEIGAAVIETAVAIPATAENPEQPKKRTTKKG